MGLVAWNSLRGLLVSSLRGMFLWDWLIYWLILGAWQAYHYYNRYIAGELRLERFEKATEAYARMMSGWECCRSRKLELPAGRGRSSRRHASRDEPGE